MRARHRIAQAGLLCAFTLATAVGSRAQSYTPAAVQAAQARLSSAVPGLVKIWVHCSAGNWTGAGVVYNSEGYILSAAHLANQCAGQPTDVLVGYPDSLYQEPKSTHKAELIARVGDGNAAATARELESLHTQDVALYRILPGQTPIAPARFATDPIVAGDEIHVAGFSDFPFRVAQEMGAPTQNAGVSIYRTSVSSVAADANGATPLRLHYEGGGWRGMSGGPVYNSRNEVVGIHSGRAAHLVHEALTASCPASGCDDNAISFEYRDAAGAVKRQIVNANVGALKTILDNFGWATSIFAVPSTWPKP